MANYPESLVGTKLVYTLHPRGRNPKAPTPGSIYTLDGEDIVLTFTTPEKDTLRRATRNVGVEVEDQLLKARWLEYVPKYVTICKTENEAILSGDFSGCWFVSFIKDGVRYAAHIGTSETNSETLKVKQAFVNYARGIGISIVSCFNPGRAFTKAETTEFLQDSHMTYMLAYMTGDGACFSILLQYKYGSSLQSRSFTVVGVRKIERESWLHVRTTEFPGLMQSTAHMKDFKVADFSRPVHVPKSISVKASATGRTRFFKR